MKKHLSLCPKQIINDHNSRSPFLDCPSHWHFVDEKCYLFKKNERSFHDADRSCKRMNAKLFEPRDLETNELVFNIAKNVSKNWNETSSDHKYIFFWIGIHDTANEGIFSYLRLGPFKIILWSCRAITKNLSIDNFVYLHKSVSLYYAIEPALER